MDGWAGGYWWTQLNLDIDLTLYIIVIITLNLYIYTYTLVSHDRLSSSPSKLSGELLLDYVYFHKSIHDTHKP